ncbi:MAG: arsenosugar biosynthesis radical SAM protein ArsS [Planctomycetia bacterium]|nr:arsenosugar biosynthesis radical SAM protein ArsS [Planctomycetia bacterium]MCC7314698.1 arsenosugar biosynthesis radical SAM protein ArsS [Planctomycetota bacterium]
MTAPATVPLTIAGASEFDRRVIEETGEPLHASSIDTMQVNVGLTCNMACRHCHVEASPQRTEKMSWETMLQVIEAAQRGGARCIDITGGEPAMNPDFRRFVTAARSAGFEVIVRTDLTIMLEDGYRDLPEFLAGQRVHLIASLPCYLPDNVNRQRGLRVYERSVEVIRMLNGVGFGIADQLPLDLVYNPLGPALPPQQSSLESDYRRELRARFGIRFTRLIAISNMPIGRFRHDLEREGRLADYEKLLRQQFNPETIGPLMCRHQVHVSWDGTLHDCDFNYALALPTAGGLPRHVSEFDPQKLRHRSIVTGAHCFGCTAGHGSSCGGALAEVTHDVSTAS